MTTLAQEAGPGGGIPGNRTGNGVGRSREAGGRQCLGEESLGTVDEVTRFLEGAA